MTKLIISFVLLLATTSAFAENLICTVSVNLQVVAEAEVTAEVKNKEIYVQAEDFTFYVTILGNSKFEMEIFDMTTPSRSYAQGYLRSAADELTWTLWSRDILLDTSCKLAGK